MMSSLIYWFIFMHFTLADKCSEMTTWIRSNNKAFILFSIEPTDFSSCQLCKRVSMETAAILNESFLTVTWKDCPELFKSFNVYYLPTLIYVANEKVVRSCEFENETVEDFINNVKFPILSKVLKNFPVISLFVLLLSSLFTGN